MTCAKKRHRTIGGARCHLENLGAAGGSGLHVYTCPECAAYHVGHTDGRHGYPSTVGAQAEIDAMGEAGFVPTYCFDCHCFEAQRKRPSLRWGRQSRAR